MAISPSEWQEKVLLYQDFLKKQIAFLEKMLKVTKETDKALITNAIEQLKHFSQKLQTINSPNTFIDVVKELITYLGSSEFMKIPFDVSTKISMNQLFGGPRITVAEKSSPISSQTPSFQAAALRSAKLGHKWRAIGGISALTDEGWLALYQEVKDKIKEEKEKGTDLKQVKHPEHYSQQALIDHAQARQTLYGGWIASSPEPTKSSTTFELKKEIQSNDKTQGDDKRQLETLISISRNVSKQQIEIVSTRPIPEDSTIFQMLEVAYANSRRTGNPKITISDCKDGVSAIKLREYGQLMKLEVKFDALSQKLIDHYNENNPEDAARLITDIRSHGGKIKDNARDNRITTKDSGPKPTT